MEIEFEKDYLRELYEQGKSSDKKHRFQPQVIRQYKNAIDKLKPALKIEDLFVIKSLGYEKLKGEKADLESTKVNQKYRIVFRSRIEEDEKIKITICSIVDLSKHYE